ncbi:MAG: PKD domain-containing protein [Planctomycetota bacterium]|nr:PKD domain-containing protein [Planctomycetota bacterium]
MKLVQAMLVRRALECALGGAVLSVTGWAQLRVVTVPWQGDPNQPHQVASGQALMLQGTAQLVAGCSIVSATWDPGDGSGPVSVPAGNARALELSHVYTGSINQPFTATLTVTDSCGNVSNDTFRVVILNAGLDVDVNRAIDHGLWNLHKRQILGNVGGIPSGYWSTQNVAAATSSALQALQVHGHFANGDPNENPYVEDVQRGLAHLFTTLTVLPLSVQPAGDPDTNGNGYGLYTTSDPVYVTGQIIDAIVATQTPNAIAPTGVSPEVQGRTYHDIVQDMIDTYAWGQTDSGSQRGGWRYSFNSDSDNSAAQWMAIGGIAAERYFGVTVPSWVKQENEAYWLPYSSFRDGSFTGYDGHFGYVYAYYNVDIAMMNTTPSGIVQLVMSAVPSSDPRFVAAVGYMARNWNTLVLNNRIYGMFATAKAMRLAQPAPVQMLSSGTLSFDWYRAQVAQGDPVDGVARRLVTLQQGDGSWDGYWVVDDIATAWAAIILSSTIVTPGPVAVAHASPTQTAATFPVNFTGVSSYHLDPARTIVNYEWDYETDGTFDATGVNVVHTYPALGVYNVTLRVTDDSNPPLQASTQVTVNITPPPFPPDSEPGGPYTFCPQVTPWLLDGSRSSDPDGSIVLYEWDYSPQPLNLSFNDATGVTVDVTSFFMQLGPGVYNVGLRVWDDLGNPDTDFTTVRVLPAGDPNCQQPPPTIACPPDFVEIWSGGITAGQTVPARTGTATYTGGCTQNATVTYQDVSVVPNTPQNPGAPEVVITRRWTVDDGCGGIDSCDQTITLLSPAGQIGSLTLNVQPQTCANEISPATTLVRLTLPGTWVHDVTRIDPMSVEVHRADGVGKAIRRGAFMTGPSLADVTAPYYGELGPCVTRNPEGRQDFTMFVNARAMRSVMKLGGLADGTKVRLVFSGKFITGEPFVVEDVLTVRR